MNGIPYVLPENMRLTRSEIPMLISITSRLIDHVFTSRVKHNVIYQQDSHEFISLLEGRRQVAEAVDRGTTMDNILLLSTVVVVLNLSNVLAKGPNCESTKVRFHKQGRTKTLPGFCTRLHQYVMQGDFNGDDQMDIMCRDNVNSGRKWIYYGSKRGYYRVGWRKNMWWCTHHGAFVYIGDFNGDSRDDMLCHDKRGHVYIAYANRYGTFRRSKGWNKAMGFCMCSRCQLFIGDFNGDSRSDMLCHDGVQGRKWIAYATSSGNFEKADIWYNDMKWCPSWSGKLFVGDFNGDHRDDLLCYGDLKFGANMFTAYARWNGSFDQTDNSDSMGWCHARRCKLSVASASKDQRDDLVCHCKNPSGIAIRFPYNDDGFETFRQWRRVNSWCSKSTEMLLVGRLKPGHCGSLVCIDKATGKLSIAFS
ncbi:hypothetical protein LSAT2_016188 [Lamellibrachia satsuma]|nr:hypothetical protein LSAT2_016188 [Lamellibrachia satsuma]